MAELWKSDKVHYIKGDHWLYEWHESDPLVVMVWPYGQHRYRPDEGRIWIDGIDNDIPDTITVDVVVEVISRFEAKQYGDYSEDECSNFFQPPVY